MVFLHSLPNCGHISVPKDSQDAGEDWKFLPVAAFALVLRNRTMACAVVSRIVAVGYFLHLPWIRRLDWES